MLRLGLGFSSISETHSRHHVTMPWLNSKGEKKGMAGNSSITCSVYRGMYISFLLSVIWMIHNTSKSAVSVQHHKTTELPYMELHSYMPSQQHLILYCDGKTQTTCTQRRCMNSCIVLSAVKDCRHLCLSMKYFRS